MTTRSVARWAIAGVLAMGGTTLGVSPAGGSATGAVATQDASGGSAPIGLTLAKNRQLITSALRVDLTRDFATLPLHKGQADGQTAWYVITESSDARMARRLGVNHAPKLRNAGRDCPACVQEVKTASSVLGTAPVRFQGAPDFSPARTVDPAPKPKTFPPRSFTFGAFARAGYSPYVRVAGTNVVFNAPIVATGDGPFDVTTHSNTHDRTLASTPRR